MSSCCNTPHIARLQKIKENRADLNELADFTDFTNDANSAISHKEASSQNNIGFPTLPRDEMTNVVNPVYDMPPSSNQSENAVPLPETGMTEITDIFPSAPSFHVPSNPLLPPGYNETLDYNALQYLNGFYRTQIGRYVRVEQQVNSDDIEIRYGYLIGVGINYLLLQDASTGNVYTIDSYSIKLFYVYYNVESPFSL